MLTWTSNSDPNADTFLDHVTQFRLSRPRHHFTQPLDEIWWSVLIELEDTSIAMFEVAVADYAQDLLIPVAYDHLDRERPLATQPLVIYARRPLIEVLNKRLNPYHVTSVRLGAITPDRFLDHAATIEPLHEIPVHDETVVQAAIDDGIAIAHDLFRIGDRFSRIHFAKIFDAEPHTKKSHSSIGRDLGQREIDRLLRDCTYDGLLDEDQFYRKSGQIDLANEVFSTIAMQRSHGTHVLALAAGYAQDKKCDTRPIICAALPSRIVADTTGHDLLPTLYLAFHILVKQARRFRTHSGVLAPVVFNFSYGDTDGPHDGTGVYATLFDFYFGPEAGRPDGEPQKAWLTVPSGNSNLAQGHAVSDVEKANETTSLDLLVLPDDRTASVVDIWMPVSAIDDPIDFATIKVAAPFDQNLGVIQARPGQHATLVNNDDQVVASLAYQYVDSPTQRGLVTLAINPTAHLSQTFDLAPAGEWKIEICRSEGGAEDPIHAWIRRDETLPGLRPGGRQAYFNNPDYTRFGPYGAPLAVDPPNSNCPIRRSSTISGFACSASAISVAAYTEQNALLSSYSSAGPLNPSPNASAPNREGPDLAAKGDDTPVLHGVISAGSRCGTWVRMNGTSVSAPQVARLAAQDINTFGGKARAWAIEATKRYPFTLQGDTTEARAGAGGVAGTMFERRGASP